MTVQPQGQAAVVDFRGIAVPADRVFFAPPPAEIGEIIGQESTYRQGKEGKSLGVKLLIHCGIVGVLIAGWLLVMVPNSPDRNMPNFWLYTAIAAVVGAGVLSLIVGPLVWLATRFKATCSYVGEKGMARYTITGKPGNAPKTELLLFEQARELRTRQTRQYLNGAYTGTSYEFRWTDQLARPLLRLNGSYHSEKGTPKAFHPYYFAEAGELTWCRWLLARADAELAEHGFLTFRLDTRRAVMVGPGFIEFQFNGKVDRCEAKDIKSIALSGGQFSIVHKDARWFSSKGKFGFPYGQMPNARLFAFVIDRFLPPATWGKE